MSSPEKSASPGQPQSSMIVQEAGAKKVEIAAEESREIERMRLLAGASKPIMDIAEGLKSLASAFGEKGYHLYLVGGAVRDALFGRSVSDIDLTTDAQPQIVEKILLAWADAVWDIGIEFGTVSAEKDGKTIEITTFRSDSYDGASRNPEVRFGTSLEEDLRRRDFTINAMAMELVVTGTPIFCDPLQAIDDLLDKVIDTPQSPATSFSDDPLRMLRAGRFVSTLGFSVAPRVKEAMTVMATEINRITPERLRTEIDKLLLGEHPRAGIDVLTETGVLQEVLPEITGLRLETDEHMRHKDIYAHSLTVLEQAIEREQDGPDLVLRWAALLHDIGKPATRSFSNGTVSFHHHEVVGARMAKKRLKHLRYSRRMIDDISQLIFLHMRFHGYAEGVWTDSAVRRYVADAGPLLPRLNKVVRADCTTRNKRKSARLQSAYEDLERRIADLAEQEDLARVRPDLDGNAIMQLLDISPGPEVGKAWSYLKDLRLEYGPLPRERAEKYLLDWWEQQHNG